MVIRNAVWLLGLLMAGCGGPDIHAEGGWLRAAPDGRALGVAYFDLFNDGPETIIIGVESEAHASAAIHETILRNDINHMQARDRLSLPGGDTLRFAPGGLHIMLDGARRDLRVGDTVQLTLLFADGRKVPVSTRVSRERP